MTSDVQSGSRRRRVSRRMLGLIGAIVLSCVIGVTVIVFLTMPDTASGAQVTVGPCRSNGIAPSAMVSISNQTSAARTFYVVIGFDQSGRQFGTGSVRERVPGGPYGLWVGFVLATSSPPGSGTLTCSVLRVTDQGS
jgi:hypothetical protein